MYGQNLEKKEETRKIITAEVETALTFKPKINKTSREMRGRSWMELSKGDSMQRTQACEALKRDVESVMTHSYV